jgi:hypothetical protein
MTQSDKRGLGLKKKSLIFASFVVTELVFLLKLMYLGGRKLQKVAVIKSIFKSWAVAEVCQWGGNCP